MKQNIFIAALLAGTLALAGCGGGGAVCNPETDEYGCELPSVAAAKAAQAEAETAKAAAEADATAAKAAQQAAEAEATAAKATQQAAEAEATAAKAAQAAAETAKAAAEAEATAAKAAQQAAETARDNAKQAQAAAEADKATAEAAAATAEAARLAAVAAKETAEMAQANAREAREAAENNQSYLALYSALNKTSPSLNMFRGRDVSGTFTTWNDTDAKGQDNYKPMSITLQGAKFSTLLSVGTTALALDTTAKNNVKFVSFDGVSTAGLETHEFNKPGQFVFELDGEYRGISGKYTCTGSSSQKCTTQVGSDNALVLGGTWNFTPGNAEDLLTDENVVTYGWWTNTAGGVLSAGVFSNRGQESTDYADYTGGGSATYKGDALGQYVIDNDDFGTFTANATLTADFTGNGTLEGMIHDFKGADGKNRDDWEVKLQSSALNGNGLSNADARFYTDANTKGTIGNWSAALYTHGADSISTTPTHVAGEFFAHGQTTERIIGAFGAKAE